MDIDILNISIKFFNNDKTLFRESFILNYKC